ncbi:MAG: flagellar hook-length control protein FliK [Devosia sp.]|uniref:flagellar hook-length control protein FliK n=1 Tax=Devosia sp. TaxID=1871048 RepID=UPI001ACFC785|nr:flagellar hook-length control protein FliK [Devosia sp.]MBN9315370.1 flagellar hook-length control protein FliK [Devosia sp.]
MTVSVGFVPAANPGLVTGTGSVAPQARGGTEGDLFAALLALIGQQVPGAGSATPPGTPSAIQPIAAARELAVPAETAQAAGPDAATASIAPAAAQTPKGKSLLKDLGDALIALNDALEAGKPVDPALERKLSEALDAAAAWFGIAQPAPQPAIDPRISALASGKGILPAIEDAAQLAAGAAIAPPAAPQDDRATPPAPAPASVPQQPAAGTASFAPVAADMPAVAPPDLDAIVAALPDADVPEDIVGAVTDLVATLAPATPAKAAAASDTTASAIAEDTEPAAQAPAPRPELARLAQALEKLVDKAEPVTPELARKLEAFASRLEAAATTTAAVAPAPTSGAPDIERIVEALAAARPAVARSAETQPFAAPALELPEAVAARDKAASTPAQPVDNERRASDADTLDPVLAEVKKPAATTPVAAEARSTTGPDPAPAPQANASATADNTAVAATATANSSQPPAAPVARTIHAAYQTPVQQVNLPQVAFEVVRQFEAGNSRFQIRLDPPELGRIDVKLDVDKSGTVNARMTVERAETLDLMQRDQRALQQALQQAGLDASRTNLEFSLRQNPFAAQGGMGDGRGQQPASPGSGDGLLPSEESIDTATTLYRGTASAGGVNLFV